MVRTLYPRLDPGKAHEMRRTIISSEQPISFDSGHFDELFTSSHAFPPTGGKPVSSVELMALRSNCTQIFNSIQQNSEERTREVNAAFDLLIGKELYYTLNTSVSELGNSSVWDFLALVVLPDLATWRFPTSSGEARARLTGGHRRHVFQRLWKRWHIFGEEIVESRDLKEDDYGNLLERNLTVAQPRIAIDLANAIINSNLTGNTRRDYTRALIRQVNQASGITEIGDDDLADFGKVVAHLDIVARGFLKDQSE